MPFEQLINSYTSVFSLLTFFLGLFLGNKLAIGRDRRKEFNEIADEVYTALMRKRAWAENNNVGDGPTMSQLNHLVRRSPVWRRPSIIKSIGIYKEATNSKSYSQDQYGEPFYKDSGSVINSIDQLIKHVHYK